MCGGSAEAEDAKRVVHPFTAAIFIQAAIGRHPRKVHNLVDILWDSTGVQACASILNLHNYISQNRQRLHCIA